MPDWSEVTFTASATTVRAWRRHWHWQLGEHCEPLLFSALGDVFFQVPAGAVWWLCTSTGTLEQVADSVEAFERRIDSDAANEWFLPGLIDVLIEQGKRLGPDECYTFSIFPGFTGGEFRAENLYPISASTHFSRSGDLHFRHRSLKHGAPVQLVLA